MKNLTYIQGAFILAITNLVTGTLAFLYRIFLSRAIGAEGVGVYQLVMPLYSLFITLVSGGITTAVSKLVAEQYTRHNLKNMYKIVRICCVVAGAWSFLLCSIPAFNAEFFANRILKDDRTLESIIIFTPAVVFIAISAVLKGYFFGLQEVKPPAFIDIVEKLIRVVGLSAVTYLLLPYGIEYICAGAMGAMAIGELISLILLYLVYIKSKIPVDKKSPTDLTVSIISKVLKIALPLSISGALTTIMDMVDAILIPAQLRAAGYGVQEALSLYGKLTGMVMPLLMFPFILISSLGTTLVPAIAASFSSHNWEALNKKCNDSFKITTVIGLGATALFLIFPRELCSIFFKCPDAGNLLFGLALGCVFEYWMFIQFAIMNGVGFQNSVLANSAINIIITIVAIFTLVPIKSLGIYGYIIGFNASAICIVIVNSKILSRMPQLKINYKSSIVKPFICFAALIVTIKYTNTYIKLTTIGQLSMCISISAGLIVYALILIITDTFTLKQLKSTLRLKQY